MKFSDKFVFGICMLALAACGGGGGGGGSSAGDAYSSGSSSNSPPTINNTVLNISVMENQTSAFQIEASDADGDTITYNVGGEDQEFFDVSTSGVVTFKVAPDFENPSDANADNVYEISGIASDSGSMTSKDFTVTVTNDPSDDVTTEGYDGTYIGAGPIQGATVCIEVTKRTCTGAQYTTTTAQDGTFSLTVNSGTTGVIRGEGGFDPVTNLQFDDDSFALSQPVTDQNFVVSPLSALINARETSEYEQLKSKLGLDSNFMIRFNNPLSNLDSEIYNKAAVVNSQLLVLYKILLDLHPTFTVGNAQYYLAADILERSGTETSLGDTAFIKELYKNVESELSLSSQQLIDLSAGTSAYMQKMYANSSNSLSHFTKVGFEELLQLLRSIVDGTSTSDEIDKLTFNTIDWINENTSWDGGAITDTEADISKTIYKLTHSGSSYYSVDNVNAKDTEFIIYVKEGDVIQFDPTSTVTSNHPFLLSTEVNDMDRSSDIGTSEGWDANSLTLTVGSDTPTTLYPHCQFHSGMYQSGKIVKVSSYDMSKIDVTNATAAMQVKGTVSKGPFKGASGHTYKVYLTSQGGSEHTHEFYEYPGLTFYMPADQGYHGAATATDDRMFKPKSHYASSDGGNDDGGGGY
tara:strand:- start:1218 stop:3122 length:1905 start_codon:yes stop_codon:yes gene_type:complete